MNRLLKHPLKIGLTGGIGSGKTTVTNIFKNLGIPVFNSDDYGKTLLTKNQNVINNVIQYFGENILTKQKIDFKKLGKIVFSNQEDLAFLNNIIHPKITNIFDKWYSNKNSEYIIKESAILFESNTARKVDQTILVKAPINLRIKRVYQRDNRSVSEIKKIINNQLPSTKIMQNVDYIINNNEKKLLIPQVIQIHNKILNS